MTQTRLLTDPEYRYANEAKVNHPSGTGQITDDMLADFAGATGAAPAAFPTFSGCTKGTCGSWGCTPRTFTDYISCTC